MQNFMKTIISAVQAWTARKIKNSTADWNENDFSKDSYVKNRTHWEEEKEIVVVPEQTVEGFAVMQDPIYVAENAFFMDIPVVGETYTVNWDGADYHVVAQDGDGLIYLGNENYVFSMTSGGDIPFAIIFADVIFVATESDATSHTISISTTQTVVHKLDSKFINLPESSNIGREGTNKGAEIFNDYEENIASGEYSHAEGSHTAATSRSQHVQGEWNIRDNNESTTERGKYAHIVGNGSGDLDYSNAHTLDWDGNAWFAGDVYVDSTSGKNKDGGSKKLATHKDILEYSINPKKSISLIDHETGDIHLIEIHGGKLISRPIDFNLVITTNPTKTEYIDGEKFDPTGMIITKVNKDGSTVNVDNYTITPEFVTYNTNYVTITVEGISTYIFILVKQFDPEFELIDFYYTTNSDGTYTLTGWKQTLNGEPSTELVVPNNHNIIV